MYDVERQALQCIAWVAAGVYKQSPAQVLGGMLSVRQEHGRAIALAQQPDEQCMCKLCALLE